MMPVSATQGLDVYVERVREANPIREVVAEHVTLDQNNLALCLFHPDHEPSLTVSPGRGTFRCWGAGCGASGDVFQFIRRVRNISFKAALDELAIRGHVPRHAFVQADVNQVVREQDILDVIDLVAHTYASRLSPKLRFYLTEERKLPHAFIDRFTMGWADHTGQAGVQAVYQRYGPQGLDVMKASGLARDRYDAMPGEMGIQDTFDDRLCVSTTHLGRITFLSGRALRPDQQPKYYHQPGREAPLFDEDHLDPEMTLITEGAFDALSLRAWDYPATAFYGGIRYTSLQKLRKVAHPIACFDGDAAGRMATMKLAAYIGPRLLAIRLPSPLDPNDFYRQRPRQEFEVLLASALDPIQFVLADINPEWPVPRMLRELEIVVPYLVSLSPAMSEGYVEIIRDTLKWSRPVAKLYREEIHEAREYTRAQCPTCGTALYARR
jgi:DNA primase